MSQPRNPTFFEKAFNVGFNLRYKAIGFFQAINHDRIGQPGDQISFLGQTFKIKEETNKDQNNILFGLFSQTPWLTYRNGFPELYNDVKGTYISDTGWGCMIRVGQMAFAQMFRKHLKLKQQEQMTEIIEYFSDFQKSQPLSIHNISRFARRQYGLLPGDWYNPSQIAHTLSILSIPLQKKTGLTFIVFNSGNLFFDQVIKAMLKGKQWRQCSCNKKNKKQLICQNCNSQFFSIGLILLTRIGLSSPQQRYLQVLMQLTKIQYFSGMIGGKPGRALFFLGTHNHKSLIYLDPHFVQSAIKKPQQMYETYFCGSLRQCNIQSIDPSLGICYYIRDFNELNNLYMQIQKVKSAFEQDFFIWVADKTPSYLNSTLPTSFQINIQNQQEQYQKL